MRFTAQSLERLKLELETAFEDLARPRQPTGLYACAVADLPPAADWAGCVLRVTDFGVLACSDGTAWIRQDTGGAI